MSGARVVRSGRKGVVVALALAVTLIVLACLPFFADRFLMRTATEMACYLTLAVMWNLLAGYAGVMSIGQQLFVGLGGYTFFLLAGPAGLPIPIALAASGAVSLLIALPSAAVLFRLNGAYFAVATWVLAEIAALIAAQTDAVGGGAGMSLPIDVARAFGDSDARSAAFWWLALGLAVLSYAVAFFLLRSPRGLALMAMRDEPEAARGLGVSTAQNRLLVYAAAALLTGLAGAIIFMTKLRISPSAAFNVNEWTAAVIFIVVIGGLGSLEGPIIGLVVFFALRAVLADLGPWYLIVLGAIAIITMLTARGGIWGLIHGRFGWEVFSLRRRIQLKGPDAG